MIKILVNLQPALLDPKSKDFSLICFQISCEETTAYGFTTLWKANREKWGSLTEEISLRYKQSTIASLLYALESAITSKWGMRARMRKDGKFHILNGEPSFVPLCATTHLCWTRLEDQYVHTVSQFFLGLGLVEQPQ